MNSRQYNDSPARGAPIVLSPIMRSIRCPLCSWSASLSRRGPGANALGATARLRAMLHRHFLEVHAGKIP